MSMDSYNGGQPIRRDWKNSTPAGYVLWNRFQLNQSAGIAQSVEQRFRKPWVRGSNPRLGSMLFPDAAPISEGAFP